MSRVATRRRSPSRERDSPAREGERRRDTRSARSVAPGLEASFEAELSFEGSVSATLDARLEGRADLIGGFAARPRYLAASAAAPDAALSGGRDASAPTPVDTLKDEHAPHPAIDPASLPAASVDADPAARLRRETPVATPIAVPIVTSMRRDEASLSGDLAGITREYAPHAPERGEHAAEATPAPSLDDDSPAAAGEDVAAEEHEEAAAHGAGPARPAAAGGADVDGEEALIEEPTVEQLAASDDTALNVPQSIDLPSIQASWEAPSALASDVLPKPDKDGPGGKEKKKAAEPAEAPAAGEAKPAAKKPARLRPEEKAHDADALAAARSSAQRAWADLSAAARRSQQAFLDQSNQVANELGSSYRDTAIQIETRHYQGIDALTQAADQSCADIESSAFAAEGNLDAAANDTLGAIRAAAASAWGAISANERSAGTQIDSIVGGLVAGHQSAFNGVITSTRTAIDKAVGKLNTWYSARNENYPIATSTKLAGAQHEKVQKRIQPLVEHEVKGLNERKKTKIDNWTQTRDSTVCALSCGYRAPLEAHRTAIHTTGRQAVSSTLRTANKTLKDQVRDARAALKQMRKSAISQVRTQQRSSASQMTSQARGSLQGARREAQGAVSGVAGATRSALPGYWRATMGLEAQLRRAGPQGAPAIDKASKAVPSGVLRGLERTSGTLKLRLAGNRQRLEQSLADKRTALNDTHSQQQASAAEIFSSVGQDGAAQMDASVGGMVEACSGLASSVTQAASSWAQPFAAHFAGFIAEKSAEAQTALNGLMAGTPPAAAPAAPAAAGGAAADGGASCGGCASQAGGGGGGAGPAPAGGTGASSEPSGLRGQGEAEVAFALLRESPATLFATQITEASNSVDSELRRRAGEVGAALEAGVIDTVNEAGVTAALRGMTAIKGQALDLEIYRLVYPSKSSLSADLSDKMGSGDDYSAAVNYLAGNNALAAQYELRGSTHWYNDEEDRIEATMRALSPTELGALGTANPALLDHMEGVLDGTDANVFRSLREANYARADAYRLRDRVDAARRDGDADAVHTAIAESTAATSTGYGGDEVSAADRRAAVVRELGGIVGDVPGAATTDAEGNPLSADALATERAVAYVIRDIEVQVGGGHEMPPQTITLSISGANRDLTTALLRNGEGSVEARAARLGVELQRRGDPPSALNLDRAVFDDRFAPDNPHATREEREENERRRVAARADRARVLLLAAQTYGNQAAPGDGSAAATDAATATTNADGTVRNPLSDPSVVSSRDALISQLGERFGDDSLGRRLTAGMLTDERPSAATSALAMRHAMYSHAGTNEELIYRFTERMTRDEVAAMRGAFRTQTGLSLDAELGVYGQGGTFTELSGDDRLRMERAMLGVARDDRERAEAAAFAIQQQRQETGSFGAWLASGSMAEEGMNATDRALRASAGGSFDFSPEALMSGRPLLTGGNFDATTGRYTGPGDRGAFLATTESAQQMAQNYVSRIDAYANVATTGIAILGAIAAAVITVATGGAAGPLIAAAVVAGLASMGANYAIKGGRYGWEQAAVDLGMTAVQAVTAGVGAQLGAAAQVASKGAAAAAQASRTVVALSRLFGSNPIVNQIMVGAITGAIGGLGNTALQEGTWEHGGSKAIGALFEGLARGMLSGAVTSAATQGLERLGGLGQRLQAMTSEPGGMRALMNVVGRGAGRALISGTAGMASKASEVAFDATVHPNRRFDAGEALMEIGQAGLHAAIQALGEGAGEGLAAGRMAPRLHAAGAALNAERLRQGLPALEGSATRPGDPLNGAAEDLLFLATHGRDRDDRSGHVAAIAPHGSLEHASAAMARPLADGEAGAPTRRATGTEEEASSPHRRSEAGEASDAAPRSPHADEAGVAAPHREGGHAAAPLADAPPAPRLLAEAANDPTPLRPQAEGVADTAAPAHTDADSPAASTEASRRSQRVADSEASFADAEFDALVRDLRNSEFGYELEAAKRRAPAALQEDSTHSRAEVDEIAHRNARRDPPDGRVPGAQIQHDTKTLDVTRNLPPGMNPLHADVINENLRWLQSRKNLPATELHVDPAGGGTRYYVDDVPRGRVGDAGAPGEQLDLFAPAGPRRAADYNTEHKFADAYLIPAASARIAEARRRAGLAPLDPRLLAIAAGEMARWQTTGHSGTERSGRNIDLAAQASARPATHAESPARPRSAQMELDFNAPARAASSHHDSAEAAPASSSHPASGAGESSVPARVRVAVEAEAAARVRVAESAQAEAPRLRVADPDAELRRDADALAEHEASEAQAHPERRLMALPKDGAAAAIRGSDEMTLSSTHSLAGAAVAPALRRGVMEAMMVPSLEGNVRFNASRSGEHAELQLTRADGKRARVRIVVGDTEGGDIANFHRAPPGSDADFIVVLSRKAHPEAHGRALAHELGELRYHDTPQAGRRDAFSADSRPDANTALSAHDRGRLAEMEHLALRLADPSLTPAARAGLQREVDTLAGHLGLLHPDDASPHMSLADRVMPKGSAARTELDAARVRARTQSEAADQLAPARSIDAAAPLSANDLRRIGALHEAAATLERLDSPARRRSSLADDLAEAEHATRRLADLLHDMGLAGHLAAGSGSEARMARVMGIIGEPSPAATRIRAAHVRSSLHGDGDNALRPGLRPDGRTILSTDDHQRLTALSQHLGELDQSLGGLRAGDEGPESLATFRLRHQAELMAAEMGLVFGAHGPARLELAISALPPGSPARARLLEIASSAKNNPLLIPRTGNAAIDVPLLIRQARAAHALGDIDLASRLTELAGLHLVESGLHGASPAMRAAAQSIIDGVTHPHDRAALTDIVDRQQAGASAAQARARLGNVESALAAARQAQDAGLPVQARRLEILEARVRALRAEAESLERIALRPHGMDREAARTARGSPESIGAISRLRNTEHNLGSAHEMGLARQMFGDSEQFQSLARMLQLRADFVERMRIASFGNDANGNYSADSLSRARARALIYERFASGHFIDPTTGEPNQLSGLERVRAQAGSKLWGGDASTPQHTLADSDVVSVKLRNPNGELQRDSAKQAVVGSMTVRDALNERTRLMADSDLARRASPPDTARVKLNQSRINDLSEALGEAAGVRFATSLDVNGTTHVGRGAGVPDVVHVVGKPGDPDFRVTVVECKGGDATLGYRGGRRDGRRVDAEQTSPEYLRSLANEMIAKNRSPDLARAILAALDQGPPTIAVVVVRQGIDNGNPTAIDVTDYPVTRSGH